MFPIEKSLTSISNILLLIVICSCQKIPSESITITAMGETFSRIRIYSSKNGGLPDKLSQLPKRKGYMNRTTDAWGRELIFEIDEDGSFSLLSLGKDGTVGGSGENLDIIRSYIQNKNGSWILEQ